MAQKKLAVEGLSVAFDGTTVFEDVALSVTEGEWRAVTGRSGTGKTTLLRAIAGLIPWRSGDVRLAGDSPEEIGWTAYRRRVSYVSQRPALHRQTVRWNLDRPFRFSAASGELDADWAASLLERVDLDPSVLARDAESLSVGEQQRVCLVRALLLDPDVLLLDEPTSALDAESVERVEELLAATREGGTSALVVTHDGSQVERLCSGRFEMSSNGCSSKRRDNNGGSS